MSLILKKFLSGHWFRNQLLFAIILCLPPPVLALEKLHYRGLIQLQAVVSDSDKSWFDGGLSKLRYDENSFPIRLGKVGLHVDYHATDTIWLRSLTTLYTDSGVEPELIEAYLNFRPVPTGPLRIRGKLGIAWESRYSVTTSTIN